MLNTDSLTLEHQERLLASLQRKVSLDDMPQPKLSIPQQQAISLRSGRGNYEDHMMLMKNYVCQCGNRVSDVAHSTTSRENGTALDNYTISCKNCGDNHQFSFMSMRKALQESEKNPSIDLKNKRLYPYL